MPASPSLPLDPSTRSEAGWEKRLGAALLLAALILSFGFSAVGWDHSVREIHESRQIQTALSARYFQQEGWSLAYPLPLFGPPWSAPFEFPLYQYCAALVADTTGLALEPAGRLTALAFFYLALPAFYLLQAFLPIPRGRWWLLPALLLVSPAHLYYSRSFMIESTALCTAAWFLLFFCRAVDRLSWRLAAAALAAGMLAALVKFTTLVVFLVPAAVYTGCLLLRRDGPPAAARPRPVVLALSALLAAAALVAGFLWTRHADAVKAANPLAAVFVSSELREFVFGLPGQRLTLEFWQKIAHNVSVAVMPVTNAVILGLFGLILVRRARGTVLGLLLCFAAGPLVFANLHAVHDYYFYACGVFPLAALAVAWSDLLDQGQFPAAARGLVVTLSLGFQVAAFAESYLPIQRQAVAPPELPALLREVTAPDDIILVLGEDWNPLLSYFAGRRAIMVVDRYFEPEWKRLGEVLSRVDPRQVTSLVVTGPLRRNPAALRSIVTRLGLLPNPILIGATTHLYATPKLAATVIAWVEAQPLPTFTLADTGIEGVSIPRQRFRPGSLPDPRAIQMMHPAPDEIVHPFGIAAHELGHRVVVDAHAPTDVVFTIPPGATRVVIEFGILPGAYAAAQPTDGVEFQVVLLAPGAGRLVLFTRGLDPVPNIADRGVQTATLPLPAGAAGRLVFRTLPGPAGSIASDWAYWAHIEIR